MHFFFKKMYGRFAGPKKRGRNNEVTVLPRWPLDVRGSTVVMDNILTTDCGLGGISCFMQVTYSFVQVHQPFVSS